MREEERRARRRKELGVEITLDNCADTFRWLLGQIRAEEQEEGRYHSRVLGLEMRTALMRRLSYVGGLRYR